MAGIDPELHERIAVRIREYAIARGILLSHLPEFAGVPSSSFWSTLKAASSPRLELLRRIALALEVDVTDLIAPWPTETE